MAKSKISYTRRSCFSGLKSYKSYIDWLKNRYNAVDGSFGDAIIYAVKHLTQQML
jgi:hypothetical protein